MNKKNSILLNDLVIKEISSIIMTIDEQIIDLHKCSSDDFLGLNSNFKNFYNQSKGISDNAHEIFKSLSEISNRNLFLELQSLYKDLSKIQNQFSLHLNKSTKNLKNIQSLLDQFFIPIKNLKQNLSTLKFLLANLTFNDTKFSTQIEKKWINVIQENNLIIDEYHESCINCEKLIFSLETEIIATIKGFESVLISKAIDLESILNNIHYAIVFFAEKHEEVKHQIPELTTKTDRNSEYIADIITNLQYQDIIRQKIEHIQQSHKGILKEFDLLQKESTAKTINQSQLYQKIKDISGLQAAILVKANKEYQLAIEKITESFLEIGNEMFSITDICKRLNNTTDSSDEIYLTRILQRLSNSEQVFSYFIETNKDQLFQIGNLNSLLSQTANCINGLTDSDNRLNKVTEDIISHFSHKVENYDKLKETISQIKGVFDDINLFENTIQMIMSQILINENELTIEVRLFIESIGENQTINNANESINSILSQLQIKSSRISQLLNENIKHSNSTISEIKESIKQIRYYDLFEKTISKIIAELKEIYEKLIGVDFDMSKRDETLNSIKSLYTMETEHMIHNSVISKVDNELIIDDPDIENKNSKRSSDEVELF